MSGFGRPREYDRAAIAEAFASYIETEEIPILAKFAALQGFGKQVLYDFAKTDEDFSYLISKCLSKKEGALEEKCLRGETNPAMSIFSLKQLGWTDRNENTLKGDPNAPIAIADVSKQW